MAATNQELLQIPGVGKRVAADLETLGIKHIRDLKGKSPEKLYERLCEKTGLHIDRCMLYTFRCAVYFASHQKYDPRLLRWWNWKDA